MHQSYQHYISFNEASKKPGYARSLVQSLDIPGLSVPVRATWLVDHPRIITCSFPQVRAGSIYRKAGGSFSAAIRLWARALPIPSRSRKALGLRTPTYES